MSVSQDLIKNCTDRLIGMAQMFIWKAKSIDFAVPSIRWPHVKSTVPAQSGNSGEPKAESTIESIGRRLCNPLWYVYVFLLHIHTGMTPHLVGGRIDAGVNVVFDKFEMNCVKVLRLGEAPQFCDE